MDRLEVAVVERFPPLKGVVSYATRLFSYSVLSWPQLHPKVNFISCPQDKEQETMMNAPRMFITFDSKEIGSCLQFVEFPR